jgi:hypothetical protein
MNHVVRRIDSSGFIYRQSSQTFAIIEFPDVHPQGLVVMPR